jgi:hypothetical protein
MNNPNLLGLLTAPTRVGSGDLLGGVIVMIMLLTLMAWWQISWFEFSFFALRALDVLRIKCLVFRARFLYGCYRFFDVFNSLGLAFAVRLLQLHTFLLKVNDHFFGVHKSINAAKPPNVES